MSGGEWPASRLAADHDETMKRSMSLLTGPLTSGSLGGAGKRPSRYWRRRKCNSSLLAAKRTACSVLESDGAASTAVEATATEGALDAEGSGAALPTNCGSRSRYRCGSASNLALHFL